MAVSPDGRTLFVANADNNCVMVVDISNSPFRRKRPERRVRLCGGGFHSGGVVSDGVGREPGQQDLAGRPTARVWPRGPTFLPPPRVPSICISRQPFDYIGQTLAGAVSFIERPDTAGDGRLHGAGAAQFALHARAVSSRSGAERFGHPGPGRRIHVPIKYVLYIIKENRTYDQVFGDFRDASGHAAGNGDPGLTMYGEKVTPNHHQIARDYVLLDNLYCNGEVSVDGHSWCDAAIATDYNQRSWILSYSNHGYIPGNDEMETPAAGYLWDLCKRHGLSYRNYGEGGRACPRPTAGAGSGGRDMDRVAVLDRTTSTRRRRAACLPRFTIMSLGENHTQGTTPGAFTPDACVASNDLGLGRIVEAATRSRFWKEMAIFVIEDDAQNGPDHVDAHRTDGLVISPYCKRGVVDSTLYTTASMVRTIELILGLPPLTQYDAGATPMFNCFTKAAEVAALQPADAPGGHGGEEHPEVPRRQAIGADEFQRLRPGPGGRAEPDSVGGRQGTRGPLSYADPSRAVHLRALTGF